MSECETCPYPSPRRGSTEMLRHAYELHAELVRLKEKGAEKDRLIGRMLRKTEKLKPFRERWLVLWDREARRAIERAKP